MCPKWADGFLSLSIDQTIIRVGEELNAYFQLSVYQQSVATIRSFTPQFLSLDYLSYSQLPECPQHQFPSGIALETW